MVSVKDEHLDYELRNRQGQAPLPGGPAGYRERLLAKNFESFYSHNGRKFLRTISPYNLPDRPVLMMRANNEMSAHKNWCLMSAVDPNKCIFLLLIDSFFIVHFHVISVILFNHYKFSYSTIAMNQYG